jgi:hypothetical protein
MARLPYLAKEELEPADRDAWERILTGRGTVHTNYRAMLHSPELAARVCAVGDYLIKDSKFECLVAAKG